MGAILRLCPYKWAMDYKPQTIPSQAFHLLAHQLYGPSQQFLKEYEAQRHRFLLVFVSTQEKTCKAVPAVLNRDWFMMGKPSISIHTWTGHSQQSQVAKITGALRGPWIHSRLRFHTFPCFVACNLKIKPISNTPSAAKLGITTAVPPPRGQVRQGLCNIPIQRKTNMEPHKKMLGEFSQCFQPARSWKLPARFTTQDIQKKSRFSAKRSKLCVKVFLGRDLFFSWNYILQSNKCDFCAYSGTLIKRPPGKLQ